MNKIKKEIKVFAIIMIIISIIFNGLIIKNGGVLEENIQYALILMFSPGIVALVINYIYNRNLKGFGWRLPQKKYMLIGYLVPLMYIFIAYSIALLSGLIIISSNTNMLQFFINPILLMILVIGEDIGWQGFLFSKLSQIMSFKRASIITGFSWASFHYPMLIFGNYNQIATPTVLAIISFTVLIMSANFIMNLLKVKSGSLWAVVIFHAAHNSFLQDIHQVIDTSNLGKYFITETGLLLPIVVLLIVYALLKNKKLINTVV